MFELDHQLGLAVGALSNKSVFINLQILRGLSNY